MAVEVRWTEGQRFEARTGSGVDLELDGTGSTGASPMEALLISLASCMGIDVVDILGKMRVPLEGLSVSAEADRRPDSPRRFTAVRLTYHAQGLPESEHDKLQRAVDLSRDTYCSVLHTLNPDLDLSIRIETG